MGTNNQLKKNSKEIEKVSNDLNKLMKRKLHRLHQKNPRKEKNLQPHHVTIK